MNTDLRKDFKNTMQALKTTTKDNVKHKAGILLATFRHLHSHLSKYALKALETLLPADSDLASSTLSLSR